MHRIAITLALVLLLSPGWSQAEPAALSWSQLRPAVPVPENPFNQMSGRQMDDLRLLAQYRMRQSLGEAELANRDAARHRLEDDGIDIAHMFELRETVEKQFRAYASQTNTTLVGKEYRIPGFITPIEFDGDRVVQFFLVPTAGACIHTPPPAPNQLVLVDYPQGLELPSILTPFWVTGVLQSEAVSANVAYKDGQTDVNSSYSMRASEVELYKVD